MPTKTKTPYADATVNAKPRLTELFTPAGGSGFTPLSEVEGVDLELFDLEYNPEGKFGPCIIFTAVDRAADQDYKLISSSQTLVPIFREVMDKIEQGELPLPLLARFVKRNNPSTGRDFWAVE